MSETKFLIRQDGDVIHVANKNAGYYVGKIYCEGDNYKVEGVDKTFMCLNNALEQLLIITSRVD